MQEKPLSIALREINEDLLDLEPTEADAEPRPPVEPDADDRRPRRSDAVAQVVLGVGGGIAAYKACELLRRLTESGHDVTVVPTAAALRVRRRRRPGRRCPASRSRTDVWADVARGAARAASASRPTSSSSRPATADLLARAAHGLADDLLTNTLLTARCPVRVRARRCTPRCGSTPPPQANVATLRARGVARARARPSGRLTGADTGTGRLPEPERDLRGLRRDVLLRAAARCRSDLAGRRVVVTAGGTREPLDPVRFLGNRSSGQAGLRPGRGPPPPAAPR